jgi:hypothetical protein
MPSLRFKNVQLVKIESFRGVKYVFIKFAYANLSKCIMWLKKLRKGKQEWIKAYIIKGYKPKILNMLIKTN